MTKVKMSELSGAALDWAVAKCEGFTPFTDDISWIIDRATSYEQVPRYSTDINQPQRHCDALSQCPNTPKGTQ